MGTLLASARVLLELPEIDCAPSRRSRHPMIGELLGRGLRLSCSFGRIPWSEEAARVKQEERRP
jgi:hypothetical protein